MCKRLIVFLLGSLLVINTRAQSVKSFPVVVHNGTVIGNMYDGIKLDTVSENAYMVDTLTVFCQKIAVYTPISLSTTNGNSVIPTPYWTVHVEEVQKKSVVLRFDSYISGDSYYLRLEKQDSGLYINDVVMLWRSVSYCVNGGTKELPDMMSLVASKILYKEMHALVKDIIVFDDYFDNENSFESYYCPRKYTVSIKKCLKLMRRKHKFWISDFEEGEEQLKQFDVKDRTLKQ